MGDMPKKTSAALSSHGLSFGQAAFTPDGDTYLTVVYTQDGGKVGAAHLPTSEKHIYVFLLSSFTIFQESIWEWVRPIDFK